MTETDSWYIDLCFDELALWNEYTDKIDALHAEALRSDKTKRSGYVYFAFLHLINDTSGDLAAPMKIGISRTPDVRLEQLQRTPVVMPYTISPYMQFWSVNALQTERELHTLLRRYRIAGEWFRLPFELIEAMSCIWYVMGNDDGLVYFDQQGHGLPLLAFLRYTLRWKRAVEAKRREERRAAS